MSEGDGKRWGKGRKKEGEVGRLEEKEKERERVTFSLADSDAKQRLLVTGCK